MKTTVVVDVWEKLDKRLVTEGFGNQVRLNMRQAYVAALYGASAAITRERAHAREISEAAFLIENRP